MSARDELGNPITQQRWEAVLVQLEMTTAKARKFASILMEGGPADVPVDEENGCLGGVVCCTCGSWHEDDDDKIVHEDSCCIPEVEAFLANPENSQVSKQEPTT